MADFRHFAAIDWSGAVGERHLGIAVAICGEGREAPCLVRPSHRWSRMEVLDWLTSELPGDTLVGLDLGISLPFADKDESFPGWSDSPADARELWALIDDVCSDDPHLAATSFVDHIEASRYFRRHGGREGDLFGGGRGRFRVTEDAQRNVGCNPYSNFNLVGAAQVGKSSLTGMRMLNRLPDGLPVWPIDPLPSSGSCVIEIYTSLAAIEAGRRVGKTKLRTVPELNQGLAMLGSAPIKGRGFIADHKSDALITAAWLRNAASKRKLWRPTSMTEQIAQTEGWTFGAL